MGRSGVIRVTKVISDTRGLITLLITTHEPPSKNPCRPMGLKGPNSPTL